MISVSSGIISGLIASALVSGGPYLAPTSGLGYPLDPILLTSGTILVPVGLIWVIYFGLSALVWGTLFAVLSPLSSGPFWFRGILFGAGVWLLTAAIVEALEPTATVLLAVEPAVLHLLFGLLLGLFHAELLDEAERERTPRRILHLHG